MKPVLQDLKKPGKRKKMSTFEEAFCKIIESNDSSNSSEEEDIITADIMIEDGVEIDLHIRYDFLCIFCNKSAIFLLVPRLPSHGNRI